VRETPSICPSYAGKRVHLNEFCKYFSVSPSHGAETVFLLFLQMLDYGRETRRAEIILFIPALFLPP
jgi:hypothetical protein